jgi:hypothetical protein
MNYRYPALVALLVLALIVVPGSAFTAKKLVIAVQENGDADINFDYQLTWPENFAYSVIPGKEQIVQSALRSKFPSNEVDSIRVTTDSTDLTVKGFAAMSTSAGNPESTTYKTPAVSFMIARDLLDNYPWIARLITPDFSPEMTKVEFPNGQQYTFYDASEIPAIACF